VAVGGIGMAALMITIFIQSLFWTILVFAVSTLAYAAASTMILNLPADIYWNKSVATVAGIMGFGCDQIALASTCPTNVWAMTSTQQPAPSARARDAVTKAVIPAAGMGTRFLPATKAMPKEMLPVVDKPLIQYAVEEAVAAGITEMIFVTGRAKRAIEDHFDKAYELEAELQAKGKTKLLKETRELLPEGVTCVYVRQAEALGLGHAVLCARHLVGNEPFAVILADDLIDAHVPVMKQMSQAHAKTGGSVIAVQNVAREDTGSYGIVSSDKVSAGLSRITNIVEKPKPEEAPSTLGVVGRYILSPRIFHFLENLRPGAGREIQLTDAIGRLLREESVMAYEFQGQRYDCGSKLGYLKATVNYALKHPEVADEFRAFLGIAGAAVKKT
jgi:UTP--glucose-1-phosphate uridylyltransferase